MTIDGLTITDTVYTHDWVDWHYHEQPYFTFILEGQLIEGDKKNKVHAGPGTLLFHNWQDPHYNSKPAGRTRGFHLELSQSWIDRQGSEVVMPTGSSNLQDPRGKLLKYQLFKECKGNGPERDLAITALLLELLQTASQRSVKKGIKSRGRYDP